MNRSVQLRLASEHELLQASLPRLAPFVELRRTIGNPPAAYRFLLRPFGFRVAQRDGELAPFDPAQHGDVELVLSANPDAHPVLPWQAQLLARPGVAVWSPHIGANEPARGVVCWIDRGQSLAPSEWLVHAVLGQVLRIVSGEVFAVEGYALHEAAKLWYAAHRDQLPFARVPLVDPRAARAPRVGPPAAGPITESTLGIEFGPAAPARNAAGGPA